MPIRPTGRVERLEALAGGIREALARRQVHLAVVAEDAVPADADRRVVRPRARHELAVADAQHGVAGDPDQLGDLRALARERDRQLGGALARHRLAQVAAERALRKHDELGPLRPRRDDRPLDQRQVGRDVTAERRRDGGDGWDAHFHLRILLLSMTRA